MRVGLITNLARARSPSMTLYARRLQAAFRAPALRGIDLEMVDPWLDLEFIPGPRNLLRPLGRLTRLGYYASRLALFPLQLRLWPPDIDVVHVVDHAAAELAIPARRPAVVTVHDLIPLKLLSGELGPGPGLEISRPAAMLFRRALRALAGADAVIAASEATRRDLERFGVRTPVHTSVVHHGVDDIYFRPDPKLSRNSGPFRLLSVGNAHGYKNVGRVVAAFLALRARGLEIHLERIGPLSRDARADIARAGAGRDVRATDAASPESLLEAYARADLLCFPSLDEGFGWPPLECSASGTPVLASKRGALVETAGPSALIEDPTSVEEIARGIERFAEDPDFYRTQAARAHAHAARFRWTSAARATAEVYRAVV